MQGIEAPGGTGLPESSGTKGGVALQLTQIHGKGSGVAVSIDQADIVILEEQARQCGQN